MRVPTLGVAVAIGFLALAAADAIGFRRSGVKVISKRGFVVRWDREEAKVGDDFIRKIPQAIWESAWFVLVLSPAAMDSDWVEREIGAAFIRQTELGNRPFILPLLHQSCEVSPFLRALTWADFTDSYEAGLEQLLVSLSAVS